MNRGVVMRVAMFTLGLLVVADMASAQRGEAVRKSVPTYEVDDAVGDPAVWTKSLVGRFSLDGSILHNEDIVDLSPIRDAPMNSQYNQGTLDPWSQPVQGKADCTEVGTGSGLQCMLNVSWPEQRKLNVNAQLGGAADLTPGVVVAGVSPSMGPGKLRILLVDMRGIAHPGAITLRGKTASAQPPCVDMPGMLECKQLFSITENGNVVFVTFSTTIRSLRDKLERKQRLEHTKFLKLPNGQVEEDQHSAMERSKEQIEERIVVSFSLRRESQQN